MTHEVIRRIDEMGPKLAALAEDNERLGRLSDDTVALIRSAGVIRMLQPTTFGGYATHPREFAEAVMAVASHDPAAGWVCGVVGVHPWEIAQWEPRVGQEIWGDDPDTWIASPYAPHGVAEATDGGYALNGRWSFSSGADHCEWDILGAFVGNGKGQPATPPTVLHMLLPRSDYAIVDDSWDVIGLAGSGSKDVVVQDAFVPAHRAVGETEVGKGQAAQRNGVTDTLYRLPLSAMFPLGLTAAVIGACEGALALHLGQQRGRIAGLGAHVRDDPYVLYAAAEAASEIQASRIQLIDGICRLYDLVDTGKSVTLEDRTEIRRNQIRCAWRAVSALDEVFVRSGSNAIRHTNPLQRYWRDAHAGLQHMIHVPGTTYHANTLARMGLEVPRALRILI